MWGGGIKQKGWVFIHIERRAYECRNRDDVVMAWSRDGSWCPRIFGGVKDIDCEEVVDVGCALYVSVRLVGGG